MPQSSSDPLLRIENLSLGFRRKATEAFTPVTDHVSFEIRPGEVFGLVGESGCGKTVTCLGLLRLLPRTGSKVLSGRALFEGKDLLTMNDRELRAVRGAEIAMIFQEPSAAMNPLLPIRSQLRLPFRSRHFNGDPERRILELLERVGFSEPDRILKAYPHELSGGMLQRVMIAHTLLLKPKLLLADEPTTALDVTVQAQILELLAEMQRETGLAVVFITHNLNLVAQYADRVAVMYAGRIVETAAVRELFAAPAHPYSRSLMACMPIRGIGSPRLRTIPGQAPQPGSIRAGCMFAPRCPDARPPCQVNVPTNHVLTAGHEALCDFPVTDGRPI